MCNSVPWNTLVEKLHLLLFSRISLHFGSRDEEFNILELKLLYYIQLHKLFSKEKK